MALHRDKSVWGEDASEFKPERWMDTLPETDSGEEAAVCAIPPPAGATRGWNGIFSFIEGPRLCIGLRLALFQYKVILADLIKNFEFLPVEGPDGLIETVFSVMGQPYVVGKKSEGVKLSLRVGGHWFWGHEKEAWSTPDRLFYQRNFEKFGTGIFVMKGAIGHPDILAISDPAALSQIFTKCTYNYSKSAYTLPLLERLSGQSLVWAEGDEHKRQRAIISPIFTHAKLRGKEADIHASVDKLLVAMNQYIDRHTLDDDGAVQINALPWTEKVAIDAIGRVTLGYDFKFGEAPEAQVILDGFRKAVDEAHMLPGFLTGLVIRAFPFIAHLPIRAIQAQGVAKLGNRKLATTLVRERKLLEASGQMRGTDYLSSLFRLYGDDESVLNEISDQMPFLDACIKEMLRLFPPVEHSERVAIKDDVLPLSIPVRDPKSGKELNSVTIRAGQLIFVSHRAISRSKDVWVDADQFKPERWLETLPPSDKMTKGWNGLFSFLEGPRMCIGFRLAILQLKGALSGIIKNFELLPVDGPDGEIESYWSNSNMCSVVGKRADGGNFPVRIKSLHAM
ncbi:hypothetical protein FRB96_001835 [Tulasnella sp. 330]|nr:hypothetical protein FRB96_001835 [Tulasnella sp. 330]